MLPPENRRLAGYMLTGNRSMFLETDGSLALFYHCPLVHSPLHTMNQCYDKIPILYEVEIHFVDPITRQTYPDAVPQICSGRIKNLFQLEMDQEDSWYTLSARHSTPGQIRCFWSQENNTDVCAVSRWITGRGHVHKKRNSRILG